MQLLSSVKIRKLCNIFQMATMFFILITLQNALQTSQKVFHFLKYSPVAVERVFQVNGLLPVLARQLYPQYYLQKNNVCLYCCKPHQLQKKLKECVPAGKTKQDEYCLLLNLIQGLECPQIYCLCLHLDCQYI